MLQSVQERAAWYSWSWVGTKPADNATTTSELTSRAISRVDFLELILLAIFLPRPYYINQKSEPRCKYERKIGQERILGKHQIWLARFLMGMVTSVEYDWE